MASAMVVRSRTSRAEVVDFGKNVPDLAVFLGAAIGAAPIGDAAQAGQRRERAVENPQDLAEGDLVRRHQQHVAAELAALAHDDAVALQLKEDLLEEFTGNALLRRDLADHHGLPGAGERDQGAESIFCLLRDHLGKNRSLNTLSY